MLENGEVLLKILFFPISMLKFLGAELGFSWCMQYKLWIALNGLGKVSLRWMFEDFLGFWVVSSPPAGGMFKICVSLGSPELLRWVFVVIWLSHHMYWLQSTAKNKFTHTLNTSVYIISSAHGYWLTIRHSVMRLGNAVEINITILTRTFSNIDTNQNEANLQKSHLKRSN